MGKIKDTGIRPRGVPAGEELAGESQEVPQDLVAEGGSDVKVERAGAFGVDRTEVPPFQSMELVPPTSGSGGVEPGESFQGDGPGFFKRLKNLDDKVDVLLGKVFDPKYRPGQAVQLLKQWESVGPLGASNALAKIGGCDVKRRYPLLAHLIGIGGEFQVSERGSVAWEVNLEGLYTKDSRLFLPPVFHQISRRIRALLLAGTEDGDVATVYDRVFRPIENAWASECDWKEFGQVIKREESSGLAPELVCVRTGWKQPKGHATGLVYAKEGDKHVLYACNAGESGKLNRSVEKFEIADMTKFSSYLRRTTHLPNSCREIWFGIPKELGLVSVKKSEQIPDEFSRQAQKRGNCPIASRKSCQLAMLWSMGRQNGLDPESIKRFYKMTTTAIRMEGVGLALRDDNPKFLPRVLKALISKWDRPDCRRLAYRVADRLMELHGVLPVSNGITDAISHQELGKAPYVDSIGLAVRLCALDLKAEDSDGMSMLKYAKDNNNAEVVKLLRKLGV